MEKRIFLKPFKILAVVMAVVITITIVFSTILFAFYEKAIVRYMKNYLDEHLLTQLSMDDIHFRVLRGFPNATIEVKNVVVLSGEDFSAKDMHAGYADTLLKADHVFLQFNLFKMLQKQYELKKIEITGGAINILFDNKNRNNLKVWKSDTSAKSGDYAVKLKSITIANTSLRVISKPQKLLIRAWSYKTSFKGDFKSKILSGLARGDLLIHELSVRDTRYVKKAKTQLALNLLYSSDHFRFREGEIRLNKAQASLKGEYAWGNASSIDLTLSMAKFGLEEMFSLLPFAAKFNSGNYTFAGNGKLNLLIKGSFEDLNHFLIKSDFRLNDCKARNTLTGESLDHVNIMGTVSGTNRKNFVLQIDTLNAELGKGMIRANFLLRDLNLKNFKTAVIANVDLKALKKFAEIDTIEKLDGFCRAEFGASGNITKDDASANVLDYLKQGSFGFEDVALKLKNKPVELTNLSGKAYWNEFLHLDSVKLTLNETRLQVSGDIYNLSGYILKKSNLKANLSIKTDILDITKYLNQPSNSKSGSGYKSFSLLPPNVSLKADIGADEFVAGKFKSPGLRVKLSAEKDSVYLDNFTVQFPAGSIDGIAFIVRDKWHNISITCNAKPHNINIQELFYAFNNFTQTFIVDKNIRGFLDGTLTFYAQWDSALRFNPASIKAKGDFQINNGELVQFDPMLKLSKYIDVEELKHIRFKTLKNTIFISNRIVNIPEMAIHSSAFNIRISGHHSFDNQFDYRMKVLLSEVLFNKARKKKKEIDEFLVEESPADQTTIPLIVAGTPANFDVKFDRKKAFNLTRGKMKDDDDGESQTLQNNNVRIEWEEPEKEKTKQTDTKSSDSDIKVEWDD